jgi:hypothetical protein
MAFKLSVTILATAAGLAACNGPDHKVCVDQKTATEYALKWGHAMDQAIRAKKVDKHEADAIAKKVTQEIADQRFGSACTMIDEESKRLGL